MAHGEPAAGQQRSLTVLLVEDNDGDAELVREAVGAGSGESAQIELRHTRTIGGALDALASGVIDVVLLDLSLPDASGLDGLRRLLAAGPSPSIVVLTGSSDEELGARAINEGAQDYLTKGAIDGRPLLRALRYAAERQANARRVALLAEERAARAAAEQARQESDRRAAESAAVFAAIADVLVVYDAVRVVAANPTAQARFGFDPIGLTPEELCSRLQLRRLDGTPYRDGDCPALAALQGETTTGAPVVFHGADGVDHVVQRVAAPLRGTDGRPGAVSIWRDITEREQLLAALQQQAATLRESDRRKDQFLAMLGHELRNPLAAVAMSTELLVRPELAEERRRHYTEVIRRQTRQLARLVDDLLDVSRITRGRIELQRSTVELHEVVEHAVEATRSHIEDRGHALTVRLPDGPVFLDADPSRLQQVIGNLLHNAAKYTAPGGRVSLAASTEGGCVRLTVSDTGAGIAPDLLPHVFEPFLQGETSLARTDGGLGIGLTVVQALVQKHGGSVSARSAGPGKGSEFIVQLPSLAVDARPDAGSGRDRDENVHSAPAAAAGRCVRVLLVEDDKDVADTVAGVLRARGHVVEVAENGRRGIERAMVAQPDLMLVDIGLPDLSGYEVVELLRPRLGDRTRFVAVTGYGQADDRRRAIDAGFDAHLVKPIALERLEGVFGGI